MEQHRATVGDLYPSEQSSASLPNATAPNDVERRKIPQRSLGLKDNHLTLVRKKKNISFRVRSSYKSFRKGFLKFRPYWFIWGGVHYVRISLLGWLH